MLKEGRGVLAGAAGGRSCREAWRAAVQRASPAAAAELRGGERQTLVSLNRPTSSLLVSCLLDLAQCACCRELEVLRLCFYLCAVRARPPSPASRIPRPLAGTPSSPPLARRPEHSCSGAFQLGIA